MCQATAGSGVPHTRPIRAPIRVWWTTKTLHRHGQAPIDWHLYTSGPVEASTVMGEHTNAVHSIQVHHRIGEIVNALRT
jgi:hypothetical protein